jgi:hypothetical protein
MAPGASTSIGACASATAVMAKQINNFWLHLSDLNRKTFILLRLFCFNPTSIAKQLEDALFCAGEMSVQPRRRNMKQPAH